MPLGELGKLDTVKPLLPDSAFTLACTPYQVLDTLLGELEKLNCAC